MRSNTLRRHARRDVRKTRKTRKGGMLKTALATALLASGAQGKTALGEGKSYLVGPYGSEIPHPSRNVAGLSVLPQNVTPSYLKNRAYPKGPLFPPNIAHYNRGWPQSPNTFVKSTGMVDYMSSVGAYGTRYTSAPEIQTWNPYLRGDPEEMVDYYEGYSNADKKLRMNKEGTGGLVKRKDTPMWKAALRHSAELPEFYDSDYYTTLSDGTKKLLLSKSHSDSMWKAWAEKGRNLGMDIPLEDPRRSEHPPADWADVPSLGSGWVLKEQLYHHGLAPKKYMDRYRMKGNLPLNHNWRRSNTNSRSYN
jgi:hypothetical protein